LTNFFKEDDLYLIAEIGGNHQGSYKKALELTELAIKSGADCIKFQLYTAKNLVNPKISFDRFKHFQKFELKKEEHIELAKKCINSGKHYTASIWDLEMIDWIQPYLDFFKIGSGDLTAREYLIRFAETGKPIVLSTGLSNFIEVKEAIEFIREVNCVYKEKGMIVVMQCTSMYPIEDDDANLAVIKSFSKIKNIIPGYSDHTRGTEALVNSISMGAKVLEFHFTNDKKNESFRDHKVSLEVEDVIELKKKCLTALKMIGNPKKMPLKIELENDHRKSFRRGIYPKFNIKKGDKITKENIICLRPCEGISAEYYNSIIGRELNTSVEKLQILNWEMFKEI